MKTKRHCVSILQNKHNEIEFHINDYSILQNKLATNIWLPIYFVNLIYLINYYVYY